MIVLMFSPRFVDDLSENSHRVVVTHVLKVDVVHLKKIVVTAVSAM